MDNFESTTHPIIENELRILALDLGKRRIGVAVSDELGVTAQGLETIQCRNKRTDLGSIARIIAERGVSLILVGHPLNMSGQPGAQAEWVEAYAQTLEKEMHLPVKLWDERLTSAEASRLLRDSDAHPDRKTGTLDRMSAVILLQSYLDSLAYERTRS
jgi:putative Holliday junction resolvase